MGGPDGRPFLSFLKRFVKPPHLIPKKVLLVREGKGREGLTLPNSWFWSLLSKLFVRIEGPTFPFKERLGLPLPFPSGLSTPKIFEQK